MQPAMQQDDEAPVFCVDEWVGEAADVGEAGQRPFSDYELAVGAAAIRELRAAILFARAEPGYFPPAFDPDTGETVPQRNWRPAARVFSLVMTAVENPVAARMLADAGWDDEVRLENWEAMLRRLPPA